MPGAASARTASAERRAALIFVRHGQTDWNAVGRMQGQSDIPLNEIGRSQARRNGRRLRAILGEDASSYRFVASPLSRATETMRIARQEMGLDPDGFEIEPRLVEIAFGAWEGHTLEEIERMDPESYERRLSGKWHFTAPGKGAESYDALAARITPVLDGYETPTVVVAHGGVLRAYLSRLGVLPGSDAVDLIIPQDQILSFAPDRSHSWS